VSAGHVIVSGGTAGIGLATVRQLLAHGHTVSTFGVDDDGVTAARHDLSGHAQTSLVEQVDIADQFAVDAFVKAAADRFGVPHGLVNNAAVRGHGDIFSTDAAMWDRHFDVNVKGVFLLTRPVVEMMRAAGAGSVVNLASGSGYGRPQLFAYCATKGAVMAMTKALALDVATWGIRVNAVLPGATRTEMVSVLSVAEQEEFERRAARNSVARAPNDPADVARAISWLLSDEARTVSGAVLEVGVLPRYAS
jgi:NAD(P)-dependent dehydrogenase (short-subunit alcohol dehydrogenase family)